MIVFEDEHLLVVNKPAGWNTHAPSPWAGEGVYDWLRHREPRWAPLSILHRLDKETSGLLVFGKSTQANRSLTAQFTDRGVHKSYRLWTDGTPAQDSWTAVSSILRAGDCYVERPLAAGGERAETRFRVLSRQAGVTELEAEPVTGRTHQIRVHAAAAGCPVLGDTLYGGAPFRRVCLHAARLAFDHPVTGAALEFLAPPEFGSAAPLLRLAVVDPEKTGAFRLVHGAADGHPGWYVDVLGGCVLSQGEAAPSPEALRGVLEQAAAFPGRPAADAQPVYHKTLNRHVRQSGVREASPRSVQGPLAEDRFVIRENGARFELSFGEGYSVGLFLDQRDNRRRFITGHVAAGFSLFPEGAAGREVLNTFAYTCGFSVCAALGGARVTSLDLSRKYLEWGRRNFALNGLDPAAHDFIYGDAFDWMRRLARKGRAFDALVLDPPTFSQSAEHGVFQAAKDYGKLVASALPLLKPGGVLLSSSNTASWAAEEFVASVLASIQSAGRRALQQHYAPQPPDFPVHRAEPAYLKTLWTRVG